MTKTLTSKSEQRFKDLIAAYKTNVPLKIQEIDSVVSSHSYALHLPPMHRPLEGPQRNTRVESVCYQHGYCSI